MPKHKRNPDPFQNALQHLIEAQALAQREMAETRKDFREHRKEFQERVEWIVAVLHRLTELLPDALRGRIGFTPSP